MSIGRAVSSNPSRNARRALLLGLVYLALACRLVIPAGYMPAPLGQGGPIMLCPGGFFGAAPSVRDDLHAGHHGDHHAHGEEQSGSEHAGWEHCPVGSIFAAAALTSSVDLPVLALRHVLQPLEPARAIASIATQPYQARAPPSIPSIDA
jgi:hypothetical protein